MSHPWVTWSGRTNTLWPPCLMRLTDKSCSTWMNMMTCAACRLLMLFAEQTALCLPYWIQLDSDSLVCTLRFCSLVLGFSSDSMSRVLQRSWQRQWVSEEELRGATVGDSANKTWWILLFNSGQPRMTKRDEGSVYIHLQECVFVGI